MSLTLATAANYMSNGQGLEHVPAMVKVIGEQVLKIVEKAAKELGLDDPQTLFDKFDELDPNQMIKLLAKPLWRLAKDTDKFFQEEGLEGLETEDREGNKIGELVALVNYLKVHCPYADVEMPQEGLDGIVPKDQFQSAVRWLVMHALHERVSNVGPTVRSAIGNNLTDLNPNAIEDKDKQQHRDINPLHGAQNNLLAFVSANIHNRCA